MLSPFDNRSHLIASSRLRGPVPVKSVPCEANVRPAANHLSCPLPGFLSGENLNSGVFWCISGGPDILGASLSEVASPRFGGSGSPARSHFGQFWSDSIPSAPFTCEKFHFRCSEVFRNARRCTAALNQAKLPPPGARPKAGLKKSQKVSKRVTEQPMVLFHSLTTAEPRKASWPVKPHI